MVYQGFWETIKINTVPEIGRGEGQNNIKAFVVISVDKYTNISLKNAQKIMDGLPGLP